MSEIKQARPINHYDVTIDFNGQAVTHTYVAATPGKARASAWSAYLSAYDISFKDFLKTVRSVRKQDRPRSDGYDYVARAYGKRFMVGDRVRYNEGEGRLAGTEGVVVYPGQSTAHVHVVTDERDFAVIVHPSNCDVIACAYPRRIPSVAQIDF